VVNSRIAFNTIIDGISKVKADRQTIISQQNSLDSTAAQFEVGTRTMVDVVNAQQRLFEAQQQLASDQYNLINFTLTLKYLAGTLNVNDLELVNSWLATTRVNGFYPDKSNAPQ
jgi:outer membrane protein